MNLHFLWTNDKNTRSLCCIELPTFTHVSGFASSKIYVSRMVPGTLPGATKGLIWVCSWLTNTKVGGLFSAPTTTSGIFSSVSWSHLLELENSLHEWKNGPGDWNTYGSLSSTSSLINAGKPQVVWQANHRLCLHLFLLGQGKGRQKEEWPDSTPLPPKITSTFPQALGGRACFTEL